MSFKKKIQKVLYDTAVRVYKKQIQRTAGWQRIYLTYYAPPIEFDSPEYHKWLQLDEFHQILETSHKELLRFPFAKTLYTLDYIWCVFKYGISYEQYFRFLFYKNHSHSYRNKQISTRRINFVFYNIIKKSVRLKYLQNKFNFAEHWHDFYRRKYCDIQNPSFTKDQFTELFQNSGKIIVKPLNGRGGHGIRIFNVDHNLPELYDQLKNESDEYIVEEYIAQTGLIHTFNPSSLNTIRVITIREHQDIRVLAAFLRVGREGTIVDNLHSGGWGFSISLDTGKLFPGISLYGHECLVHPDTNIKIAGQVIPRWEEVKQFCIDAHRIAPVGLEYIGWDVCVCEDQLYMIEGNAYPSAPPCVENQNFWKDICEYFDRNTMLKLIPSSKSKALYKQ